MTLPGEPPPPTLEELRARPIGRTGAELVLRLRLEMLLVDAAGGVFRVTDTEGKLRMILGTAGPVHSAVVFAAIAATKRWALPKLRKGYTVWPAETLPHGATLVAVMPNEFPVAIGQGATDVAAFSDLARIRESVGR